MMTLQFKKMHGLGNDFVMVRHDALPSLKNEDLQRYATVLCHRQFGIGADGLIVVAPPSDASQYDVKFIYINNDGTFAEMCGNGMRCFARFAFDEGYVNTSSFKVETLAGLIQPTLHEDGTVTVNMGAPILEPSKVPFACMPDTDLTVGHVKTLGTQGSVPELEVWPVSMGNPHAILFEDSKGCKGLVPEVAGPIIETHPQFPAKTNVEFVTQRTPQTFHVVVWERGCGFTLACGTGACATAVVAILSGRAKANETVFVELPGGTLEINWSGLLDAPVYMKGPAVYSFSGTLGSGLSLLAIEP
jgi:diaminopimelate epimerase